MAEEAGAARRFEQLRRHTVAAAVGLNQALLQVSLNLLPGSRL